MFDEFINFVKKEHPLWEEIFTKSPPNEFIISPAVIELNSNTFKKMDDLVFLMNKIRNNKSYQSHALKNYPDLDCQKHYAVQSCYDLHIENGEPKLIEINTNGAFQILTHLIAEFHGKSFTNSDVFPDFYEDIKSSFYEEWEMFNSNRELHHITILDENPEQERAYFEFLMFKELFKSWGLKCEIQSVKDLKLENKKLITSSGQKTDFIYNRYTDFLFEKKESAHLKKAYQENIACFSPHPREYLLLTDKGRFYDWNNDEFIAQLNLSDKDKDRLKMSIPRVYPINNENKDWLWEHRKKLFFKPQRSHGGKGALKGSGIAKKRFDELFDSSSIAQDLILPMYYTYKNSNYPDPNFKYDFRLFIFGGRIQSIGARLYQGQTTNFKNLGSGVAPVIIKNF